MLIFLDYRNLTAVSTIIFFPFLMLPCHLEREIVVRLNTIRNEYAIAI